MNRLHGIIFAYEQRPELRELTERRTAASIPFGGRYRLTLQEFSDQKLDELLPDTAPEGVTTPAQRYLELKEAILNHQ